MNKRKSHLNGSDFDALALGAFLKAARERAELSQDELALRANLVQQAISAIERGVVVPSLTSIEAIANALSFDVLSILKVAFRRVDDERELEVHQILTKLEVLSDDALSLATQQIDTLTKWDKKRTSFAKQPISRQTSKRR